jgi:hypothetical protein
VTALLQTRRLPRHAGRNRPRQRPLPAARRGSPGWHGPSGTGPWSPGCPRAGRRHRRDRRRRPPGR